MNIKEHASKPDIWIRGLFIIVFAVIFYFLCGIIWLVVVIQFIIKVVTGELNSNLTDFSTKLTSYALQILSYLTFQSEEKPWPFGPVPGSSGGTAAEPAESATEVLEQKDDQG